MIIISVVTEVEWKIVSDTCQVEEKHLYHETTGRNYGKMPLNSSLSRLFFYFYYLGLFYSSVWYVSELADELLWCSFYDPSLKVSIKPPQLSPIPPRLSPRWRFGNMWVLNSKEITGRWKALEHISSIMVTWKKEQETAGITAVKIDQREERKCV